MVAKLASMTFSTLALTDNRQSNHQELAINSFCSPVISFGMGCRILSLFPEESINRSINQ
jgi:hypothetical protein